MTTINAATYIMAGSMEILLPIGLGLYFTRHFERKWKSWFIGALMFLVSLIRFPLNSILSNFLASRGLVAHSYVLLYLTSSITAGVFEETARYIGLRFLVKDESYQEGIIYGSGHGGVESIFLVGINVLTIGFILIRNPSSLPGNQLFTIITTPWYLPLIGAYERTISIAIHISLSVMVLEAIRQKEIKYFLFAVFLHTAIDYVSASATGYSIIYAELVLTGFALGLTQWAFSKVREEIRVGKAFHES